MNKQAKVTFHVLVADDSADDRFLLRTAMRRANRLQIVAETSDGEETIAYFRKQVSEPSSQLPDLLLLDLSMPVRDGFHVLKWLRTQQLGRLIVVALTDSMNPEHIRRALDLGADLFQVKPKIHNERVAMVLALEQHLLTAHLTATSRHLTESSAPRLPGMRPAANAV